MASVANHRLVKRLRRLGASLPKRVTLGDLLDALRAKGYTEGNFRSCPGGYRICIRIPWRDGDKHGFRDKRSRVAVESTLEDSVATCLIAALEAERQEDDDDTKSKP